MQDWSYVRRICAYVLLYCIGMRHTHEASQSARLRNLFASMHAGLDWRIGLPSYAMWREDDCEKKSDNIRWIHQQVSAGHDDRKLLGTKVIHK